MFVMPNTSNVQTLLSFRDDGSHIPLPVVGWHVSGHWLDRGEWGDDTSSALVKPDPVTAGNVGEIFLLCLPGGGFIDEEGDYCPPGKEAEELVYAAERAVKFAARRQRQAAERKEILKEQKRDRPTN